MNGYPLTVADPANRGYLNLRNNKHFAVVHGREARVFQTSAEIAAKIADDRQAHQQAPPANLNAAEQADWTFFYNYLTDIQSYDYTRWQNPQTWSDKLTRARGALKILRLRSAGTITRALVSYDNSGKAHWTGPKPQGWEQM
ncbi:hypothetical protein N7G274_004560 [Stereocaulon virgatum]|uniref:Uncharacterized protein n=1 Tax=Stereocaulon virgatum TaxID=373712 RepID=A0ABR4AD86_9LECA